MEIPIKKSEPSVIQKAKSATQSNEKPKRIISIIEQEAGGVLNAYFAIGYHLK